MKYLVLLITAILLFISNSNTLAISRPDSTNNDLAEKLDPKIILEKYLDAIGGRDALSKN